MLKILTITLAATTLVCGLLGLFFNFDYFSSASYMQEWGAIIGPVPGPESTRKELEDWAFTADMILSKILIRDAYWRFGSSTLLILASVTLFMNTKRQKQKS
jgi:hypothetical protein